MLSAKKVDPLQLTQSQLLTAREKLDRAQQNIKTSIKILIETRLIDGKNAYFQNKISPLLKTGPAGSGYLAYMALKEEIVLEISQFSHEKSKVMRALQAQESSISEALTNALIYIPQLYSYSTAKYVKEAADFLLAYPKLLNFSTSEPDSLILSSAEITQKLDEKIANAIKAHQASIKHAEDASEKIKALEEQVAALKKENAELKAAGASVNATAQSTPAMFKPK